MANLKAPQPMKASKRITAPMIEILDDRIVITLPLEPPTPSASGKTMVIGTTRGNITNGDATFEGRPVTFGANVYFK